MILDKVENLSIYESIACIKDVIKYIQNNDLLKLPNGKYEIYEDKLFLIIQEYDSKKCEEQTTESHDRYIDVQCVLEGEEAIGWTCKEPYHNPVKRDDKNDISFYTCKIDNIFVIKPGDFVVFFPHDIHRPCGIYKDTQRIKKALFKIKQR